MDNSFKLEKVSVKNFGRIDDSRPVIMYLGDKDTKVILAEGDQEEGKSSWLEALKGLLGANLRLKEENYINRDTNKIEADMEFEYSGRKFRVSWRKSYFKLQEYKEDEVLERAEWTDLRSPAELLKKIIGYVAETPVYLQTLDGAKQVEKFKEVLGADKELSKKEDGLKSSIAELANGRRDANRLYEGLKKKLSTNPMYVHYHETEERFKAGEKNIDAEREKLREAQSRVDQYNKAEVQLENLKKEKESLSAEVVSIEKQIQELQVRLELKKSEVETISGRIETGDKFIEDNKAVKQEYDKVFEEYSNIAQYNAYFKSWQEVLKDKKDMDEAESLVALADSQKDELKAKMRNLYSEFLPDIEGLEIVSVEGLDGDKPVGVYYNDEPISILSESELWGLYMKIWDALKVKFVIIDNVSSLGSGAVDMINTLAQHGCYIFAAQMKRGQEFNIEITDKL